MSIHSSKTACTSAVGWGVYHRIVWLNVEYETGNAKLFYTIIGMTENTLELSRIGEADIYVLTKSEE